MASISYKDPTSGTWVEIPTGGIEEEFLKNNVALLQNTTALADGTNLNTVITPGTYNYAGTNITNAPTTVTTTKAFILFVMRLANPGPVFQIIYSVNGSTNSPTIFYRESVITSSTGTVTDSWKQLVTDNTYASETQAGLSKIYVNSDNYLCIDTQ